MCSQLVRALVIASEKASNIARACRSDDHLFQLLVQQKKGDQSNPRFLRDFKTLADVLIQEMVRHDVGKLLPELKENIRGEEDATFCNGLGESITVEIQEDVQSTAALLEKVLDNDKEAALALAQEVHRTDVLEDYNWDEIEKCEKELNFSELGVWIDPIDATVEYIQAKDADTSSARIKASGLECVTVLIGVYEIESGLPLIGVVNQPFVANPTAASSLGQIYWGVCMEGLKANNIPPNTDPPRSKNVAVLSRSENRKYIQYLRDTLKYNLVFSAGAGHKLLKLILGEADLFLVSKATTYKWDTCAPQAILRSLGGNLINLQETIDSKRAIELNYAKNSGKCNIGGVLGFRTQNQLLEFSRLL